MKTTKLFFDGKSTYSATELADGRFELWRWTPSYDWDGNETLAVVATLQECRVIAERISRRF